MGEGSKKLKKYRAQIALFAMIVPCMVYTFVFSYLPLQGWIMAFQKFKPGKSAYKGLFRYFEELVVFGVSRIIPGVEYKGSEFVGFDQFKFLFDEPDFWRALKNTLAMSSMNLIFGFIFSIGFALLLNEIRLSGFKKITQTISYLPHFLSWIIVCSLIADVLSTSDGMLNNLLMSLKIIDKPILWLGEKKYFWWVVAFGNVWKEMGWNSIIYIAAMAGIDLSLYEAADIDGANRYHKMWHITLPGIRNTIIVIMIMNLGWILNAGFEVQYILGRGLVQDVAQTLDIFVLKYGISIGNYSLATAAGIFKSVVSLLLVGTANYIANKVGDDEII